MSVEYQIYKVDPEGYTAWMARTDLDDLDDDQYDRAMEEKFKVAIEVTERLYPPELHNHVALFAEEIVEKLHEEQTPELLAFRDFARTIYWSQIPGASQPNELDVSSETLELTLGKSGVEMIAAALQKCDATQLTDFCTRKGIDLSDLPIDLVALRDSWLKIAQECLAEGRGLAIECFG